MERLAMKTYIVSRTAGNACQRAYQALTPTNP
jgi:hypothetical protein